MEIFVANLDSGIEEELLSKLFEPFGPVTNTVLVRDKITRISKGYGFVIMENAQDAQRAIDDLNGRELAGKILNVKVSVPKQQQVAPKRANYDNDDETRYIDSNGYNSSSHGEEDLPLKVVDEASYTTSVVEDGLIKIRFNNKS